MKAFTPSETMSFIEMCLKIREIPYIAGPPGIGKSAIVAQIADQYDLELLDIRLSQYLVEDLTGIPSIDANTNKAKYNPFATFPMVGDPLPPGKKGWLIFLDELSSASEEILAATYSLLHGHTIGGHKIHPKARIVAAGNRSSDSAIARDLPDTIISRVLPIEMRVSVDDWIIHAKSEGVHPELVSFLTKYPDFLLSQVDPNKRAELETFPNPRSWMKAAKFLALHEKLAKANQITKKDAAGIPLPAGNDSASIEEEMERAMASSVGDIAAHAFIEHYNESVSLPYPWEVAQSPASARIPSSPIGQVQMVNNIVEYFFEAKENSRDGCLQYLNRMDGEMRELFADTLGMKIGSTASDQALLKKVKQRLNVDFSKPTPASSDPDL